MLDVVNCDYFCKYSLQNIFEYARKNLHKERESSECLIRLGLDILNMHISDLQSNSLWLILDELNRCIESGKLTSLNQYKPDILSYDMHNYARTVCHSIITLDLKCNIRNRTLDILLETINHPSANVTDQMQMLQFLDNYENKDFWHTFIYFEHAKPQAREYAWSNFKKNNFSFNDIVNPLSNYFSKQANMFSKSKSVCNE